MTGVQAGVLTGKNLVGFEVVGIKAVLKSECYWALC